MTANERVAADGSAGAVGSQASKEIRRIDAQGGRDADDVAEADVAKATFDTRDVGRVESGIKAQLLLRQAAFQAAGAYATAERREK